MEFQDLIDSRRMVRDFEDRPPAAAVVERILANATHAPSAGFTQGWDFLVLEGKSERERFWRIEWPLEQRGDHPHLGVLSAPVLIVPVSDKEAYLERYTRPDKRDSGLSEGRWPVPYWHIDTAFATLLALLTATDAGLGALFFRLRHTEDLKAAFGIPAPRKPIGAIALGYPARPAFLGRRRRRPLSEVVHRGRW